MTGPNSMPRREVVPRLKDRSDPKPKRRKSVNPVSAKKRARRALQETKDVFADVICRSNGRCELDPTLPAEVMHHRRRPGRVDAVWNLLHLNRRSHDLIHREVDWSNRHGLILETGDDPNVLIVGCDETCTTDHRKPRARLMESWPTEEKP